MSLSIIATKLARSKSTIHYEIFKNGKLKQYIHSDMGLPCNYYAKSAHNKARDNKRVNLINESNLILIIEFKIFTKKHPTYSIEQLYYLNHLPTQHYELSMIGHITDQLIVYNTNVATRNLECLRIAQVEKSKKRTIDFGENRMNILKHTLTEVNNMPKRNWHHKKEKHYTSLGIILSTSSRYLIVQLAISI